MAGAVTVICFYRVGRHDLAVVGRVVGQRQQDFIIRAECIDWGNLQVVGDAGFVIRLAEKHAGTAVTKRCDAETNDLGPGLIIRSFYPDPIRKPDSILGAGADGGSGEIEQPADGKGLAAAQAVAGRCIEAGPSQQGRKLAKAGSAEVAGPGAVTKIARVA